MNIQKQLKLRLFCDTQKDEWGKKMRGITKKESNKYRNTEGQRENQKQIKWEKKRKKLTWSREVCLQVELLGSCIVELAWYNVDHPIWQPQGLAEVLRIADHLLHHGPGCSIMGGGQAELLHLWNRTDEVLLLCSDYCHVGGLAFATWSGIVLLYIILVSMEQPVHSPFKHRNSSIYVEAQNKLMK